MLHEQVGNWGPKMPFTMVVKEKGILYPFLMETSKEVPPDVPQATPTTGEEVSMTDMVAWENYSVQRSYAHRKTKT